MKPAQYAVAFLVGTSLTAQAFAAAPPFDTTARVAFMQDMNSGAILYQKQPDFRMPPASLAKMMTVYVAFSLIKSGDLKLDQKFTMSPETWQKWHGQGSTMFIAAGEQVSVADLLSGIITLSGNDACVVLAEGIAGTEPAFVNLMNQQREKLGMNNSHFGTANGWPDNGVTYVTARDLATLAEATIRNFPDLYKQFYAKPSFQWGKTMGGADISQENRDPILGKVPGADGLKTGHTEEAGYGFTGSAEQNGRRLVMVLAGMGSWNERVNQSISFMNWGFSAWRLKPLFAKGKRVETAEVQGGSSSTVGLVAPNDLAVTVPLGMGGILGAKAGGDAPPMKVVYDGPIKAPIKAGQHIADLVVSPPGQDPQTLPLVAESDVGEAGFFGRIWASIKALFSWL
ncbi:D-alanyl-D-alanine carboxypeptidase family protein [Sphingomonas oryzagri]|uniref:serine-type D-Ala-D-Ala carboxypeptidase n=1 Tax=Sphingomonas oryzagri TaxID=3042314 RepID=A0ABT6MY84_9SPHN|nr:D-alanyl-D-alanine carboxypeptidase family protein [Sphingomonas oryzagri]MDH7638018.1 D-alanyl-D-alanine carboxypeptidase family protein [Sphingomonas oryzagri]